MVTVPLDAVPERRTKRCPPNFRFVGRFCEPGFDTHRPGARWTGRERNVASSDHFHLFSSALLRPIYIYIYIYIKPFQLFLPYGTYKFVLVRCIFAHALMRKHSPKAQSRIIFPYDKNCCEQALKPNQFFINELNYSLRIQETGTYDSYTDSLLFDSNYRSFET